MSLFNSNSSLFSVFGGNEFINNFLSTSQRERYMNYVQYSNFYEGFHFEDIQDDSSDLPQLTSNYCRSVTDLKKNLTFGSDFTFEFKPEVEQDVLPFLNGVWKDNKKEVIQSLLGLYVTLYGDGYILVNLDEKKSPYTREDKSRIKLSVLHPSSVIPTYKAGVNFEHDDLEEVKVIYPNNINSEFDDDYTVMSYTKDYITTSVNGTEMSRVKNSFGVIPIFHFRNKYSSDGRFGVSEIADIIPINVEFNLQNSSIMGIIEYYSSPMTVFKNCSESVLEKSMTKTLFLPDKAEVNFLELNSDLVSSREYLDSLKQTIYQISNIPDYLLGSSLPANLSGSALRSSTLAFMKRVADTQKIISSELCEVNNLILFLGLQKKMYTVQKEHISEVFKSTVKFADSLPTDELQKLEAIQAKFKMGLTDRRTALKKLGEDNVEKLLEDVDIDSKVHPEYYGSGGSEETAIYNSQTGEKLETTSTSSGTKDKDKKLATRMVAENTPEARAEATDKK